MHSLLRRTLQSASATATSSLPGRCPSDTQHQRRIFSHLTAQIQRQSQQPHIQPLLVGDIVARRHLFWEPDRKAGYNRNTPRVSRKQLILEGLRDLKQEIITWKEEVHEKLRSDPVLVFRRGETDVLWDFNDPAVLDKWVASSDSDHNEGQSVCTLAPSESGRALFSGNVQTLLPKDGKIKRAGFCNMKSMRARVS